MALSTADRLLRAAWVAVGIAGAGLAVAWLGTPGRPLPAAPAASPGARILPEPLASARPVSSSDTERLLRRRGSMLGEPLSICHPEDSSVSPCDPLSFAMYGDPVTGHLDSIWMVFASPATAPVRPARLSLHPFATLPQGARVRGASVRDNRALVQVESEAIGPQPAGLPGVLLLSYESHINGAISVGLAPQADPAQTFAQPLVEPDELPLFAGRDRSGGEQRSPPDALSLEAWVAPAGLAVEHLWQGVFREEKERTPREALGRWPRRSELRQALWNASEHDFEARRHRHSGYRPLPGPGWHGVAFAGTTEHPTVRAVSRHQALEIPEPATPPRSLRVAAPGGSRQELEAYLARQPVSGRLVGHAPLGPTGTVGLLAPEPGATSSPLVIAVDGPQGAIVDPWEHWPPIFEEASQIDVRFIDPGIHRETHLLVRVEWPDRPPWTSLLRVHRSIYGFSVQTIESPGFWLNRAATLEEALAVALRPPATDSYLEEALRVLVASRTRAGLLSQSTTDAVCFTFRESDPFVERGAFEPCTSLGDATLATLFEPRRCQPLAHDGYYLRFQCPTPDSSREPHVWFVREGGQLRVAALGRRVW